MKTFTFAVTVSLLCSVAAFADEQTAAVNKDAIRVFPPITQTLGYTYSQPMLLIKPHTAPPSGVLAQADDEQETAHVSANDSNR